jgi:polyhydroxyalkanoate synthase
MDLVPKPDQVVAAAGNVARRLLYGGLADLRPMPRTLIGQGVLREVYHYRPSETTGQSDTTEGVRDPVLLVTPLAAPALCYDLRRDCSLVEHLVDAGRPTYLVEYGEVPFRDRDLGIDQWVDEAVPAAIRTVSEHAGGRPVHVVGWSLGGIFALLTAADDPDLPIASVTALGTPLDLSQVPVVAPRRPLLTLTPSSTPGLGAITQVYKAVGGAPPRVVSWASQLSVFQRLVTKPMALGANLDDADFLAQIEAVDRFTDNMGAYPGRTFGQVYHRFLKGKGLTEGEVAVGDRTVRLADVTAPVLVIGGSTDPITPIAALQPLVPLLTGSREARLEVVPGGHLGMLTGRRARTSTWPVIDEWFDQWSTQDREETPDPPSDPDDPSSDSIGSNPTRRFGSSASRNLRR